MLLHKALPAPHSDGYLTQHHRDIMSELQQIVELTVHQPAGSADENWKARDSKALILIRFFRNYEAGGFPRESACR